MDSKKKNRKTKIKLLKMGGVLKGNHFVCGGYF